MSRRPGLADVAREAGVSLGTASNVLNAPERVRPATREKVHAAIRKLGYGPKSLVFPADTGGEAMGPVEDESRPFLMTLGYVSIDLVARIDTMPHRSDRITSERIARHLGGPAANVAVAAAGLGEPYPLDVELATAIGRDPESLWALERLASAGVRARAIRDPFRDRLSRCMVLLESDGSRTKINEPLTLGELDLLPQLPSYPVRRPSWLHADGYHAEQLFAAAERLKSLGWKISAHDTGLPERFLGPDGLETLVSTLDVTFLSRRTAAKMLGGGLAAEHLTTAMAERLSGMDGRGDVVLTLGPDGAALFPATAEEPVRIAAPMLAIVDATGAGDCLVGTFLAQRLHDTPPEAAARVAVQAASLSTTAEGAQGRIVRFSELDAAATGARVPVKDAVR